MSQRRIALLPMWPFGALLPAPNAAFCSFAPCSVGVWFNLFCFRFAINNNTPLCFHIELSSWKSWFLPWFVFILWQHNRNLKTNQIDSQMKLTVTEKCTLKKTLKERTVKRAAGTKARISYYCLNMSLEYRVLSLSAASASSTHSPIPVQPSEVEWRRGEGEIRRSRRRRDSAVLRVLFAFRWERDINENEVKPHRTSQNLRQHLQKWHWKPFKVRECVYSYYSYYSTVLSMRIRVVGEVDSNESIALEGERRWNLSKMGLWSTCTWPKVRQMPWKRPIVRVLSTVLNAYTARQRSGSPRNRPVIVKYDTRWAYLF